MSRKNLSRKTSKNVSIKPQISFQKFLKFPSRNSSHFPPPCQKNNKSVHDRKQERKHEGEMRLTISLDTYEKNIFNEKARKRKIKGKTFFINQFLLSKCEGRNFV